KEVDENGEIYYEEHWDNSCLCGDPVIPPPEPPEGWQEQYMEIKLTVDPVLPSNASPIEYTFAIEERDSGEWNKVGELDVTISPGDQYGDNSTVYAPRGKTRRLRLIDSGGAPSPNGSLSVNDMAGPRYRKIGLNGLPISDSKPQEQEEDGQQPEETYVDAYTRQLRHSVTDVYSSVDSSLLPLSVRRDCTPEAYSNTGGLRAQERPDLPFGSGWRSNICSYIKFNSRREATVIDEAGASQSYIRFYRAWKRSYEENADAKTRFDTLAETDQNHFILKKKFGTICVYESVVDGGEKVRQSISSDRINGSKQVDHFEYARLVSVKDRWMNELKYEYADPQALTPSRIYDPKRPGQQISIKQTNNLVTEIKAPDGSITRYHYALLHNVNTTTASYPLPQAPLDGTPNAPVLIGVSHVDASVGEEAACIGGIISSNFYTSLPAGSSSYHYSLSYELDENPLGEGQSTPTVYSHVELSGIEDELHHQYGFTYEFNDTSWYYAIGDGGGLKRQYGLPKFINTINLPNAESVSFTGMRRIEVGTTQLEMDNDRVITHVSGPAGQYSYLFTSPVVFRPSGDPTMTASRALTVYLAFTQMELTTGIDSSLPSNIPQTEKTETFTFNVRASMALSSVTDMSGKSTYFYYTKNDVPSSIESQIDWFLMGNSAANSTSDRQFFDDPIVEVNALGKIKTFTYNYYTRILESVRDSRGVLTKYDIDELGRRTRETVSGPYAGGRVTQTFYEDPDFLGFATKTITDGMVADDIPAVETRSEPDVNGRATVQKTGSAAGGSFTELSRVETVYDHAGRKRSVKDGRGLITNFDYDERGRLNEVAYPDGSTKSLFYDDHGNLTQEVNENGVSTFHEYDEFNRRIKTTLDLNGNNEPDATYTSVTLPEAEEDEVEYNGDLVTVVSYTDRGQVHSTTDPIGKVTTNTYDNLGRLLKTDDGGFITSYGYDPLKFGGSVFDSSGFKPNAVTDPRGVTTTMVFDDLYRALEKRVSGIAGFTSTVYDNAGNPLSVTDPLNRTTQFVYDVDGQVVETTFPDLTKNKVYYTHTGKPWKQVNELNAETITQYDAAGRAVKVIQPAVNGVTPITETFYDSANNAVKTKDALGRATITEYDARNRPCRVTTPIVWDAVAAQGVHPVVETEYDSLGQVTLQRDPMGRESRKFYDRAGRAWRSVNALDHEVVSTFDPAGNVLTMTQKVTNAEGSLVDQTVTNVYDTHYRLTSSLDGEAILNEFEYDEAGNRTLVRDGLGQETSFVYDELGRLVTQTFKKDLATTADDDTWSYVYDAVHKLSQTDAAGVVTSYGYDLRSRLETVTVAGELLRTYDYDSAGRLESVLENGHPESDVSYSYDALGRATSETSRGVTHTYHYDLVGNRLLAELGTGRNIQTIYDSLNRPELILESEGTAEAGSSETRITQYGYDLGGRAVLLKPANGQVTENIYDELGRLTNRTLFKRMSDRSDSGVLAEFGWSYNEVGNVTAQYETWPGTPERPAGIRTTVMTYDLANRLAKETITDGATGVTETSYTYDAANNRKTKTVTGGSEPGHWVYDYNAGNQLMSWSKYNGTEGKLRKRGTQSYDANGNRTSETKVSLSVNEEHASLSNQGITYQAVAEGEYGEDLSVSLNAAAAGQSLSAAMIGGNHVAVTLETDMGVPDTLVNQGITYTTPGEHQPGHEVSVALVAAAPDQTPGVVVNGTDIQVTLETGVGAKAHASDQGLVYEAATAGVGGNALSVRLEKAEVDELASANIQGDEVVVRLATDDGQPDGLADQGITYTTKDAHQDGREVAVELVAAESEQTPSVQVTGDDVKVFLETGVGNSASATSQGISYGSNLPGQEGNELKVHYSLATPYLETPEPLTMSASGHDVWVNLANEGGQAATLELPGITYQAVPIGENGNGMTVSHVTAEAPDMPTVVSSVVGDHVTIQLGTGPALPARAGLYDVTLQAIDPGEDGNGITVTVEAPSSYPSYYLETSVDGKNIHVMLARDDDGNIMSRYYDVVSAIQTAASHLVTVVEGQGSYSEVAEPCFIVLEGAGTGYSMNATASDVSSALTSNPAAAALLTVINGDGNVLWEVFDDATSGGVDPVVTSTVDDVVALLADHPDVLPLMSVTGSGTAPMQPGVVSLTGGGEDFEILSPVSEIVTLLNAENSPAKDLLSAAGSGETLLQALPRTVLAGGVEPAIVTTATDVAALLEDHPLITASGAGTNTMQPGVVPLTGGGEDFEILTQAHEVVSWLTA
ncbi:MAG: hypothetical protein OJI67_14620, partial [Prosthecobacter sp.]|nr:hypothetical protein [Prosthecobacter sp.]